MKTKTLFKFSLRYLGSCLAVFILTACSEKVLEFESNSAKITGSIEGFSSLASKASHSLTAMSCTSPQVSLYKLDETGEKILPAAATQNLAADGAYTFNLRGTGITLANNAPVDPLIVVLENCSEVLTRPITGTKDQNISQGSSLIGYLLNRPEKDRLSESLQTQKDRLVSLISVVESAGTLQLAYQALTNNPTASAEFSSLFGVAPTALMHAAPQVLSLSWPTTTTPAEQTTLTMSVSGSHWSPTYTAAYIWKFDNTVISTSNNASYTLGPNSQGTRTLTLYMGQDDGGGNLDLTKPYHQISKTITVQNTVQPAPLNFSVTSPVNASTDPISTRSLTLTFITGAALSNCASFSSMALTEDTVLQPAVSDFTMTCSTNGSQTLNYSLQSSGDGVKGLRLWAKDSSGNISTIPTVVYVTVDETNPVPTITNLAATVRGGAAIPVSYSATDATSSIGSLKLQYAPDGTSFVDVLTLTSLSSPQSWSSPSSDITGAKLRLVATDSAGNSASATTAAFNIDSTAPTAPTISRSSSAVANSQDVTISATCTADYDKILYSETSSTPAITDSAWENCAASKTFTVSNGDGLKTIYAFTKDAVGNISASSSVTMTLDTTNPSVMLSNLNTGSYKGGSSQTMTWTVIDTNWGSQTLSVDYSTDNGSTWSSLTSGISNDGTEAITLPSVDSNQVKLKLKGCDLGGNCNEAISSGSLLIDSTAPTLSSVIINDGAVYAGTANITVKVSLTEPNGPTQVRLDLGNVGSGDCQSEYADDNWVSWVNASTNLNYLITPVDGEKKVCVWAKDSLGNISTISGPSTGILGVNMDTITYQVGNPPTLSEFSVTRTSGGTTVTAGDAMTISWDASDAEGLHNDPISFAYTTNNSVWKDIITNGDIKDPNNITWMGGLTANPMSASGSVTSWVAPASSYFRVRAIVRDMSGNTSAVAQSQTFNTGGWSIYAGSRDKGDGGTGPSASLYINPHTTRVFGFDPTTGDLYALDSIGIRKLSALTGLVSTVIVSSTINLTEAGSSLPSTIQIPVSSSTSLYFDSKGRMYVQDTSRKLWQIDFKNNYARLYLGGGTGFDAASGATGINATLGAMTFDESDSLYFLTYCSNTADHNPPSFVTPIRIMKLTQNTDGTPGTLTRIAGDCSTSAITYGVSAYNASLGTNHYQVGLADIAVWGNGSRIYYKSYSGGAFKIIDGTLYSATYPTSLRASRVTYNPEDGKLYTTNTTGGVSQVTPNLTGNGGDTNTIFFRGDSTAAGCADDGTTLSNYCGSVDGHVMFFNGMMFFFDGAVSNSASNYSIRYFDGAGTLRTVFGAKPFWGDGKDKSLMRGSISSIYYKKSTEPNQTAFPEGLYFMERAGMVFGHINPTTGIVTQLWGNQARRNYYPVNGMTVGKNEQMGLPYSDLNGAVFTFDNTGLPWMRTNYVLNKIGADNKVITLQSNNSNRIQDAADGADPYNYSMYINSGKSNFTLKDQTLFIADTYGSGVSPSPDPIPGIRALDFTAGTLQKIIGGTFTQSMATLSSGDVTVAGEVVNSPLQHTCGNNGSCYIEYRASEDRLYFTEGNKFRYITTPSNTATSTLVTLFTLASGNFHNFKFSDDGSQLWYFKNNGALICKDISSGKSWCDNTTDHFAVRGNFPGASGNYANNMTWKDSGTLLLSTWSGEILQYVLPTGP